jgi:hypothetical protein
VLSITCRNGGFGASFALGGISPEVIPLDQCNGAVPEC